LLLALRHPVFWRETIHNSLWPVFEAFFTWLPRPGQSPPVRHRWVAMLFLYQRTGSRQGA